VRRGLLSSPSQIRVPHILPYLQELTKLLLLSFSTPLLLSHPTSHPPYPSIQVSMQPIYPRPARLPPGMCKFSFLALFQLLVPEYKKVNRRMKVYYSKIITYCTVGASMKRVAITAKGRVQKVGYRDEVEEIARKLNVTGFVENVKPYDVRIVAEGEDEHIDVFIKRIKINKFPIDVENVEVNFDDFTGEFEYFEIKRGKWGEEIAERLDTAGKLLYKSVELGGESVEIGKKMLGKQDMMLEKQDETIDAIVEVSERIDGSKEEIVTEISALRDDLRSYMEEKFTGIEQELEAIKLKIGMV